MSVIGRALKLARHGYATDGYVDDPAGTGVPTELQAQPDDQPGIYDRAMTPEQRRATSPWETQDVPFEQQIVRDRKNGGNILDYALQKFGTAPARDAVKSAKAVRGRPVKE